jgi:hypothetical protein
VERSFGVVKPLVVLAVSMLFSAAWGASANATPPVLVQVSQLEFSSTGATAKLICPTTSAQNCSGTINASSTEIEGGKRVVGVQGPPPGTQGPPTVVKIAETSFALTPGQSATVSLKLNSLGIGLLKRFHELPAQIYGDEVMPTLPGGEILFLFHEARFVEAHKKHKSHKRHSKKHS